MSGANTGGPRTRQVFQGGADVGLYFSSSHFQMPGSVLPAVAAGETTPELSGLKLHESFY